MNADRPVENYIEGLWRTSGNVDPAYLRSSPIDGITPLRPVAETAQEDIDRAVRGASVAQRQWRKSTPSSRSAVLQGMADALRRAADGIVETLVLEVGKTPAEAHGEVVNGCRLLEYFAGAVTREVGAVYPTSRSRTHVFARYEPVGVVAAITPWNFPVNLAITKVAPAIAAGNSVVLKPAPEAAATTELMVAALAVDDLPPGSLSMVHGGREVAQSLVNHSDVACVAFTGSTNAGLEVAAAAGRGGKACLCEMGGKNALVVMADADVSAAVDAGISGAFRMAGQKCTASSRLLVQKRVMPDVLALLERRLVAAVAADPRCDGTFTGPVISARSRDRLQCLVEQAVAEGATVMTAPPDDSRPSGGAYVDPTVVVAPNPKSTVVTDELFGPVMTVEPFRELEDAVEMVNASRYGLVSSIYTASEGMSFLEAVDCGTVLINQPTTGLDYNVPFAGWKASGLGGVEQSDRSLAHYTRLKAGYLTW